MATPHRNSPGWSQAVVLCGGSPHAHEFGEIRSALDEILTEVGCATSHVEHPDALPAALERSGGSGALLVVHGLWWRMLGEAYEPWREAWGYATSAGLRDAFEVHLDRGGSLLAMHTSPICFDDWSPWGDLLGGSWQWGVSSHPPPSPQRVEITSHPICEGVSDDWIVVDEIYGDLAISAHVDVAAWGRRTPDDDRQPIVWTHAVGAGRIVVDLLGHDRRSLDDPDHRRLLANAVDWLREERT